MILGVIAIVGGLAAMVWIWFFVATYALPVIAAIQVGQVVAAAHCGLPAAIACGILAGIAVLALGYTAVKIQRPAWVRPLAMAIFMIPAGYAGYLMTDNLISAFHVTGILNTLMCSMMALVIACMVPIRLSREAPAGTVDQGMGG